MPEQSPDQPANVDPLEGAAVRVTNVFDEKSAEQDEPQLIRLGLLVTVPLPEPALDTLSVNIVGVVAL